MFTADELLDAVNAAFVETGRGFASWPDPHGDRSPLDEEYSRLTDPAKWRILGARVDAWVTALVDTHLARLERQTAIRWRTPPGPVVSRTDRLVPNARDALQVVVGRSRIGDIDDAGVTLGVGDPAVCVAWFPHCGCDACDSGSRHELDELDVLMLSIVSGAYRRLSAGDRVVTVMHDGRWSASGLLDEQSAGGVLADPSGWDEIAGRSWLRPH